MSKSLHDKIKDKIRNHISYRASFKLKQCPFCGKKIEQRTTDDIREQSSPNG